MNSARRHLLVVLVCAFAGLAHGQPPPDIAYSEVFYRSSGLRIQAYLYKPEGDGPFPVVIYNHGSREGRESDSVPFQYIGAMLTRAGYLVFVPERRGYGKSDGLNWREEAGRQGRMLVTRLQAEADDVLAAVQYLRTLTFADSTRIGVMGWSFGGIVTMFASSRSDAFRVAVNQAGGALSWDELADLRRALTEAAEKSVTPTLFMVAENDRTTLSITTLAERFETRHVTHRTVIFEAFTPLLGNYQAPGHALFSAQGASVWEQDVISFLGRYLRPNVR